MLQDLCDGFRFDAHIDFVEWSNLHRYLPRESSIEPGKYRTSRVPYVEEILQELSPQSPTTEVVVKKGTQLGFTELGNNFLFATADLYPGPSMMVFPTDAMAVKHSKKKVMPSVTATKRLAGKIKEHKSRDSGNTILLKEYPGGSWAFTGSNSPASARSDSIRYLILDDVDGFVLDAGGEGSPLALFRKRTDAFGTRKKIYINSTPTVKYFSAIDHEWADSSQGKWTVPCPRCGEFIYLHFGKKNEKGGIKFTRGKDGRLLDAWYECDHCQGRIDEHEKTSMNAGGKYTHAFPDREKRGFQVPAYYSPLGWLTWKQIVKEFLEARKDPERLKVWVNTREAEVWDDPGEQPDWQQIKERAEPYERFTCPEPGWVLTAGVDVQDNRLAAVVRAWGPREESYLVFYDELFGDPSEPEVWDQLDQILHRKYDVGGEQKKIVAMAIDSGGHKTQEVYHYARYRFPVVMAIKGANGRGKPVISSPNRVDVTYAGEKIKGGVELWSIGTDTAKSTIYSRLKLRGSGDGRYHFYQGLPDQYYHQLVAEKLITRYVKGFPVPEWHVIAEDKRNEVLDCEVYCYAAAIRSGITYKNWDHKPKSRPTASSKAQTKRPKWSMGGGGVGRTRGGWMR